MNIEFLADNAVTRKNAALIYKQFFPLYLRWYWMQLGLFLFLLFALIELVSFFRSDDTMGWLGAWGLPETFVEWPYAPIAFVLGLITLVLAIEFLVRQYRKKSDAQFAEIAPPEKATIELTEHDVTMKSASATVVVPFEKVTGLALNKATLAIGFSGAGMIIPRNAFATPAEETAFLRAIAKGMVPEALQRSSDSVRKLYGHEI
jgi:hypothetical protein